MSRIMAIDDDPDTLKLLKLILQNAGHTPVLAEGGQRALELLAQPGEPPEIVLCDVLMPVVDGYQVLLAIRRDPRTKRIPVLMLSALGQEKDVQRALETGADGYVIKPFAIRSLVVAVENLLASKGDFSPGPRNAPPSKR